MARLPAAASMLGDSKEVSPKPLVAIPDFVIPCWHSLLRLFYRERLGFPWTRTQRLLKTKDVAARDRQIRVGPIAPWQSAADWCMIHCNGSGPARDGSASRPG